MRVGGWGVGICAKEETKRDVEWEGGESGKGRSRARSREVGVSERTDEMETRNRGRKGIARSWSSLTRMVRVWMIASRSDEVAEEVATKSIQD